MKTANCLKRIQRNTDGNTGRYRSGGYMGSGRDEIQPMHAMSGHENLKIRFSTIFSKIFESIFCSTAKGVTQQIEGESKHKKIDYPSAMFSSRVNNLARWTQTQWNRACIGCITHIVASRKKSLFKTPKIHGFSFVGLIKNILSRFFEKV